MDSIKIIKKFYTQKDSLKAASYFKDRYKKDGQKVTIEIIEAYKVNSSIKKSIGSPRPDDFIILIKYNTPSIGQKIIKKAKTIIKKTKTIIKSIFKPKPINNPIPFMEIKTPNYTSKVSLQIAYNPNVIPLIVSFSLYCQVK